jgi:hypothetical protein
VKGFSQGVRKRTPEVKRSSIYHSKNLRILELTLAVDCTILSPKAENKRTNIRLRKLNNKGHYC